MKARASRPRAVRIEAFAKLNLGLAVGPRRADGFHDLATIFQSVSLADTLVARRTRAGFTLRVRVENAAVRGPGAGRGAVPVGARNLVLRAARHVARASGVRGGVRFELTKRIPTRAGLGGGSADAAAAIAAMDLLYGLALGRSRRIELAAELGSDIPFAVFGGTALGLGRGEILTRRRLACPLRAVIAVPKWGISTARAFAEIDRKKFGLTRWAAKLRIASSQARSTVEISKALALGNTFEKVLGTRQADFRSLQARLRRAGGHRPAMSGSGSAVFALIERGTSYAAVARSFEGSESLYAVRGRSSGLRVVTLE
jgi:4-diphosphocytidyl-2-C-methyl-D-erythritol kinase